MFRQTTHIEIRRGNVIVEDRCAVETCQGAIRPEGDYAVERIIGICIPSSSDGDLPVYLIKWEGEIDLPGPTTNEVE